MLSSSNDNFQSFGNFFQIFVGFELVDVHQNGIWFKLVNVDEKYSIDGERILYFIQTKTLFLKLSNVFLFNLWKPKNYVPYRESFNFVVLLNP